MHRTIPYKCLLFTLHIHFEQVLERCILKYFILPFEVYFDLPFEVYFDLPFEVYFDLPFEVYFDLSFKVYSDFLI